MKFLLYVFLFSAGSVLPLLAASDSRIVTSDGRTIPASQVKLRSNGDLEYLSEDGKIKNRIAKGHYRYARIPKPASVTEADLKYKEQQWKSAAALYHKAAAEYRLLGWQTYCLRMEAECLVRSGEKKQAAVLLRELHAGTEPDPGLLREKALADNLLAELLIDNKEYAEAGKILEKQQRLDDPDLVFAAHFKAAVILQAQGKRAEAARRFYQTALLFPKNPRRPEALYCTWNLLTELKDPNASKVADLLKRDYPDNPFARQTFR